MPITRRQIPFLLTDLYTYTLLLIYPLWYGSQGYLALTRAKYLFFVCSGCLYLLLLLLSLAYCGNGRLLLQQGLRQGGIFLSARGLFLAVASLSAICSPYDGVWMGLGRYEGLSTLLLYGAIAAAAACFGRFRPSFGYALAISGAICALIAIAQLAGHNPGGLYPQGYGYTDGNVLYSGLFLSPLGNIDLLCGFFTLVIPLSLLGVVVDKSRGRLIYGISLPLCLYVLWQIKVAAGLIAIPLALLLLLPLGIAPRLTLPHARLWAWLLVLVILGLLLLFLWCYDGNLQTLTEINALLHGKIEDNFGSSRILIWKQTLALVPQRLWLGGGPDTLAPRLNLIFSRTIEQTGVRLTTRVDAAHNEYLNDLVNLGLLGLASHLLLLLTAAIRAYRRVAIDDSALLCGGAVLAFAIQAFFSFSICIVAPLFWLLLGLTAANPAARKDRQ
ncbi:MAG: O-antigen ligase family protein [Clostridiales bacterium]